MVEIAEILRQHGTAYRQKYADQMLASHLRVMKAIEQCRTEALGGHVYYCEECDERVYSYHSCRNRHCPKCQNERTQEWLEKQQDLRLAVPYFMVTFTLPSELRKLARRQQKLIYNLLFRTSAEAAQQLALDPRFVGGQIGMIGVLHTWGRNLVYHPHVHYLIPAGGQSKEDQTWRAARKNFLFPEKVLGKLFRAKFRDALRKQDGFDEIPVVVWQQDWVVDCLPVDTGESALKYLAPYIFRVAISNNRILKLADGQVTFRYKDTDTGKTKHCQLTAEEFLRRFLQHVLPKGFVKVRYYGLFSPAYRSQLTALRQQLEAQMSFARQPVVETNPASDKDQPETSETTPFSIRCPSCGRAMQRRQIIRPRRHQPP